LMDGIASMSLLPLGCTVVSNSISLPLDYDSSFVVSFAQRAKRIIAFGETTLTWLIPGVTNICKDCERKGRPCGFSSQHRQAFCKRHGTISTP
jgi:hypothetical protein